MRSLNIDKTLGVKPLVVQDLPCNSNLGTGFNFKINFSKLDGIQTRLQFQDVSNEALRRTVGDPEILW